jgi:glutathione-regulated potassium-efflux system ancillary protein KefF
VSRTVVFFAHPYPDRSRANRALLAAIRDMPNVDVRSLYALYPDFGIDVEAEQAALLAADTIVWQHPLYWYSVPGLLKHWFDKVLARGWAYGDGGTALHGKRCLWVTTVGGPEETYRAGGVHERPFAEYLPPIEHTATFCGMTWEPPLVLHGAHRVSDAELTAFGREYRARLIATAGYRDEAGS